MGRPRLLDLFCGAGGAAVGYARAGFEVVGVDIVRQPHYPFPYEQEDALAFLRRVAWTKQTAFQAIHASPPCHDHTALASVSGLDGSGYLLWQTIDRLREIGLPWVVENVGRSPLLTAPAMDGRHAVVLCGSMFGLRVRRHRKFETSFPVEQPDCRHVEQGQPIGVYGHSDGAVGGRKPGRKGYGGTQAERQEAMGIAWVTGDGLSQAVPPAYTEFIGRQLITHLGLPIPDVLEMVDG